MLREGDFKSGGVAGRVWVLLLVRLELESCLELPHPVRESVSHRFREARGYSVARCLGNKGIAIA